MRSVTHEVLHVYADASTLARGTGLGVAMKDPRGRLIGWRLRADKPMTNTQAEYCAVIFALEQVARLQPRPREVHVFSDSEVVVQQLRGLYAVRLETMRVLHARTVALVTQLGCVTFTHVPREENKLADALASEAICAPKHKPIGSSKWQVANSQ